MAFEPRVAFRFMWRATDRGGFSAMTIYSWLAIGVGIGAMSTLLSVMYGFEGTLRDRVLTVYPHVFVRAKNIRTSIRDYEKWNATIAGVADVDRSVPFLDGEMIVQSALRSLGIVVWGISDEEFVRMGNKMLSGTAPNLKSQLPQMVVGSELADRIGVSVGSHVKLISPLLKTGPMGAVPLTESFEVAGTYASGHYDFDQQYLYVLLEDAQALLKKPGQITGWYVWGKSVDDADAIAAELDSKLGGEFRVETWKVFNSALFQSLKLEQFAMFLVLSFAIVIAGMNITITLFMNVNYKKKNIGVLRAMGASAKQIRNIFLWEGMLLGGVGLVLGASLTVLLINYIRYWMTIQLPAFYYDRSIPVEIRWESLMVIYGVAIVLIFLATLMPARRAATLDPVRAIRE